MMSRKHLRELDEIISAARDSSKPRADLERAARLLRSERQLAEFKSDQESLDALNERSDEVARLLADLGGGA